MRHISSMIDVMTPDEVSQVHHTSLKILSEIGLSVPNQEILKMCEEAGASIDYHKEVVKIPVPVMENFISRVQEVSKRDDSIRNQLHGSISTQIFLVDYMTQTRRYGLMDDIYKGLSLIQHLENFDFASSVVVPSDVPSNFTDVKSFHAIYAYSQKPGATFILSAIGAKYIVEMTKLMGRHVAYFLETVSPLQYRKESLDMALVMTKMGMGVTVGPMVIGGAIGPITIAGNCALQNAEILGSMFMGYALTGGLGYGYGSYNHAMDLKTMTCSFGSPNQALLGMAAAQMGRHYGLWSCSNSGLTDSLVPDFQAGFEKASNAVFSLLAGNGGIGGQGIVGADQGFSYEQLVLDNEWIKAYNYTMSGFEVNEDTLGFEMMKEVGIGGNFLSEEHTVAHMRDSYWMSKLFAREPWDSFENKGKITSLDRAHEFVEEVTKDYKKMQPVVAPSLYEELTRIMNEADKELAKERGE